MDAICYEAWYLRELATRKVGEGTKDIFGEEFTDESRESCIRLCLARIERILAKTDSEWDTEWMQSARELSEADHPKHSII